MRKKRRKASESPKIQSDDYSKVTASNNKPVFTIPVIENLLVNSPQMTNKDSFYNEGTPQAPAALNQPNALLKPTSRLSVESQDSDELMLQLEKLFQGDSQEDDIFEGGFCDSFDTTMHDEIKKSATEVQPPPVPVQESLLENHAAQIKSLDERLASLAGLLVNNSNDSNNTPQTRHENTKNYKKRNASKWLCEEYFLKLKLYEYLDEIGDSNRKKLARVGTDHNQSNHLLP